jgi:hypothetical protein
MIEMTKAERIFNATYHDCKEYIENYGTVGKGVGFNRLATEETVCTRTINTLMKLLGAKRRDLQMAKELRAIPLEKINKKLRILDMVEATIENNKNSIML